MFGYVKPAYGELRVREHELYRGAYCGLCRSMGKCTGCLSRAALSYDFVFLALIRYALTGETVRLRAGRCAVHPLKKRPYMADSDELRYCAGAAAVLTYAKLRDDVSDERGGRALLARLACPVSSSAARRAGLCELEALIGTELDALGKFEKRGSDDIDGAADCFGRLLGGVTSYGLDGAAKRIAYEIGYYTGRLVYVTDAADDMGEDIRLGRYNPFVAAYGTAALEEREVGGLDGRTVKRVVPNTAVAEGILTAARLDLMRLERAEGLISYGESSNDGILRGIIENIIGIGMQGELMRVLGLMPVRDDASSNV